eukprot:TRINITY_DN5678_c3_g1_i1.p1 TRINITY_DN5678_c3_g1~~TRINITY_DN5678_c3_g1_i1.p1  ORF type:complete len:396 (-),score=75.93 TRINITY_DN5678_c3_g1_i1:106-1293(-)
MSAKSAPDVNLAARGFSWHVVAGAVAIGFAAFRYFLQADAEAEAEDPSASLGLIYSVGWVLLRLFQLLLALALMLLGFLVLRQRSILYVPTPAGASRSPSGNPAGFTSPALWKLPYMDAWIETEDGTKIHGWFVYHPTETCEGAIPYTFAYFHGNAGNIGHRLENVRDMYTQLKINILIIDYRGYGDSEDGTGPSEKGFLMDAVASYRWLVDRAPGGPKEETKTVIAPDRLCLFGRSIGGAVCLKLAETLLREQQAGAPGAMPLPTAIVLENTFTSLRAMALQVFPFLAAVGPLLRSPILFDEWRSSDSVEYLARHCRNWSCCLLGGAMDELVPPAQMRALHDLMKENRPKVLKYFVFKYGGHNDTPQKGGKAYWDSFRSFMELVESAASELATD